MEKVLKNISDGPQSLFNALENAEIISEFEIGAMLVTDYQSLKNPLQYFKVILKFIHFHKASQDFLFKKLLTFYLNYLRKEKRAVIREQISLFFIYLQTFSLLFNEYSSSDKSSVQDILLNIYKELKMHLKDSKDLIKVIKIGKEHQSLYLEVSDEVITLQEIDDLLKIFETDDFAQGSLTLHSLCAKVLPKRTQFLYDFAVVTLVYLVDFKAQMMHFEQICNFFMNNSKYFNKDKRLVVLTAFKNYCNRIRLFEKEDLQELKQKTIFCINPGEQMSQNEKPKALPTEEVKKQLNKEPPQVNKKPENNPKPSKTDQKTPKINPEEKKTQKIILNQPIHQKISEIILEAEATFFNNERIDILQYFEKFSEIDFQGNTSALFQKIDELISKDRPSQERSTFWSVMLKVFEKLPMIDNYQMVGLREKLKALKGKVRENKEKVSRQKEKKHDYKENLKNQGKFVEGFKNGDREQKRSQKEMKEMKNRKEFKESPAEAQYQEFMSYSSRLVEEVSAFIEVNALTQEILQKINQSINSIIKKLKNHSSEIIVKVVGSAAIGTYLKGSPVDLLVIDKSQENRKLEDILKSCFGDLPILTKDVFLLDERKDQGFLFHLHTTNTLQSEVAGLLKKYCQLDSRVTRLIIFTKLWLRSQNLSEENNKVTGFHISLLAVNFLQTATPPVIASLQLDPHEAKLINGCDVWFNSDYSSPGSNLWTFGEVIFHFFHFLSEKSNFLSDVKQGKIFPSSQNPFTSVHPFQENLFITCSPSTSSKFLKSLSNSLSKLSNFLSLEDLLSTS
jgi:predicted nucleotidyltransferase